jgi:hypothetical protein
MEAYLETLPTEGKEAVKARRPIAAKVDGLRGQLDKSEVWAGLLGDQPMPGPGECKKLRGIVYLAAGGEWAFPTQPAVVLVVGEDPPEGSGAATAADSAQPSTAAPVEDSADEAPKRAATAHRPARTAKTRKAKKA